MIRPTRRAVFAVLLVAATLGAASGRGAEAEPGGGRAAPAASVGGTAGGWASGGAAGSREPAPAPGAAAGEAAGAGAATTGAQAGATAASGTRPSAGGLVYPREVVVPAGIPVPVPATRTTKARDVPAAPLDGRHGRRIVYDKALMTVWVVGEDDRVLRRFPVVGRWDRPARGAYTIYSKSSVSGNPYSKVTFRYMTRFAWGTRTDASIGFHSIPRYYDGRMMHPESSLGLPIATGGCVRMALDDARWLFAWSRVGDRVVVLPSPDRVP